MAAKKSVKKSGGKSGMKMVPQPHGGVIRNGSLPGNTPGTGRPPDEIRAKMRELGATKAVPFLSELLDGKVLVSLEGKCDACGHEQPITEELMEQWLERVKASIDHRLKASEQAMKYGLSAKEIVIATDEETKRLFACLYTAFVERHGQAEADIVRARAAELYGAKA